jgi:hypothetical protein
MIFPLIKWLTFELLVGLLLFPIVVMELEGQVVLHGTGGAVGVAVGVGSSVAVGVAVGVGSSVAVGVAVDVAVGVGSSVAVGVAVGVGSSVAVGVAVDVAVGVAVGVAVAVGKTPACAAPAPITAKPNRDTRYRNNSSCRNIDISFLLAQITLLGNASGFREPERRLIFSDG